MKQHLDEFMERKYFSVCTRSGCKTISKMGAVSDEDFRFSKKNRRNITVSAQNYKWIICKDYEETEIFKNYGKS